MAEKIPAADPKGEFLRIVITIITCGFGNIIGLVEGIIYLTKSDENFAETCINQKNRDFNTGLDLASRLAAERNKVTTCP